MKESTEELVERHEARQDDGTRRDGDASTSLPKGALGCRVSC